MRTLFVLRGAPGAGKSTLIRHHGLTDLAVGLDDLRRLYSANLADLDGQPALSMSFGSEKRVVAAFKEVVTARIRQGATLVLDCTNPARKAYRDYASLARRCGYRVYVIDVQDGLDDAELLARNDTRRGTVGYVDPQVVLAIAQRVRDGDATVTDERASFEDVRRLNTVIEEDLAGRYERLVVIGDVHSCAGALAKVKRAYGGWDPSTLFVFVGDLFDRGPDAAGVLDLLLDDGRIPDNVVLVEGNHDEHMRLVNADVRGGRWEEARHSRSQILASGRTIGDIERLLARMVPLASYRFAGEHVLITHAGLAAATVDRLMSRGADGALRWDLTELTMRELLLGSSERGDTFQGRGSYSRSVEERLAHPRLLQVHGHRNGDRQEGPGPEEAAPGVYTLEHGVESGGHLSVLQIDADGSRAVLTFTEDRLGPAGAAADPTSLLARMRSHPQVRVVAVRGLPGVVACNFTRRAFNKGLWDETSCKARGLFLREEDSAVLARGYAKFFNIGQAPGPADVEEVVRAGAGRPLTVRRKINGFLGIVSTIDSRLQVLSKSGVTSYSEHAAELLSAQLGDRVQELAALLEREGVSLTFEVLSRRDPHIVQEGEDGLVLLDAIANEEQMELDDALRLRIAADFGLPSPEVEVLAEAADDCALQALAERIAQAEERREEGLVITYGAGEMTKYKTRYYSEVKAFRGLLTRHLAGKPVRRTGPGAELMDRYLDHGTTEGFIVDGLLGPVIDIPRLVASL